METIRKVPKRQFSTVVPEDQFKAVIRALLDTPPLPLAAIGKKRERKPARSSKR